MLDKASEYVHNCVRFYYRGKTPTLYENEGIKLIEHCDEMHIPIPVYMLFDEKLLYLDNTEFSNGNATNSERGNTAFFFKKMDWEAIFHSTYFEQDERDYIVNRRQAELLSHDSVSLTYLKQIIFRCEADRKRAIILYGNDEKFVVDANLFSDKNKKDPKKESEYNNFIKDYRIRFHKRNKGLDLDLDLDFNKSGWEKDYELEYEVLSCGDEELDVEAEVVELESNNNSVFPILQSRKAKLRFYEFKDNWQRLNIYMNGYLCVQQPLNELNKIIRTINKASISYLNPQVMEKEVSKLFNKRLITRFDGINKSFMRLYEEFNNYKILQSQNHYFELVSGIGRIVKKQIIEIDPNTKKVDMKFEYVPNYFKLRRYIGNIVCYELDLSDFKDNETEIDKVEFLNPLH